MDDLSPPVGKGAAVCFCTNIVAINPLLGSVPLSGMRWVTMATGVGDLTSLPPFLLSTPPWFP